MNRSTDLKTTNSTTNDLKAQNNISNTSHSNNSEENNYGNEIPITKPKYKYNIWVALVVYLLPIFIFLILNYSDEVINQYNCDITLTGGRVCVSNMYFVLLAYYYISPLPLVIPSILFIVLGRKKIKNI